MGSGLGEAEIFLSSDSRKNLCFSYGSSRKVSGWK